MSLHPEPNASPVAGIPAPGPVSADLHDEGDEQRRSPSPVQWLVAALGCAYYLTPLISPRGLADPPPALLVAGMVVPGLLALAALWWLRRQPRTIALLLAALWIVGPATFGPAVVAQEYSARRLDRRSSITTGLALAAGKLAASALSTLQPNPGPVIWVECAISCTGILLASMIGWLRRSSAGERAGRLEAQAARQEAWEARVTQARLAERERIAREMHDVVAHRISLIALHSGALAHRMKNAEPESAELAGLIQANAKASLEELRGMLASLRGAEAPPEPPQPTLAGLEALVAEARAAGQQVQLVVEADLAQVPPRVSRHAYRIAQEGLTNARRHAPGAPAKLILERHGDVLDLKVSNPLADLATPDRSGSGLGLVGVVERVEQLGGEVRHGLVEPGDAGAESQRAEFVLQARLPLTPDAQPAPSQGDR